MYSIFWVEKSKVIAKDMVEKEKKRERESAHEMRSLDTSDLKGKFLT